MKKLLLGLAISLLGSGAAMAQLAPGTSGFSSAPTVASEAEYWTMMRQLGVCLADAKSDKAKAFLAAQPGTAEEDKAFSALFHRSHNRCLGNFVNASMLRGHVRGSVAEGLLKLMDETAVNTALALARIGPTDIRSLHDFAACYVALKPQTAWQFLNKTSVGTKGEVKAVRQMSDDFATCLPQGREVRIVPVNIRAAIAEAVYRAVIAPAAPNVQGSE